MERGDHQQPEYSVDHSEEDEIFDIKRQDLKEKELSKAPPLAPLPAAAPKSVLGGPAPLAPMNSLNPPLAPAKSLNPNSQLGASPMNQLNSKADVRSIMDKNLKK